MRRSISWRASTAREAFSSGCTSEAQAARQLARHERREARALDDQPRVGRAAHIDHLRHRMCARFGFRSRALRGWCSMHACAAAPCMRLVSHTFACMRSDLLLQLHFQPFRCHVLPLCLAP